MADGTVRKPISADEFLDWLRLDWLFRLRVIKHQQFRGCLCSTVFLVLDADPRIQFFNMKTFAFDEPPPWYKPLIYETMIFGGTYDGYQRRYRSERHARRGHDLAYQTMTGGGCYKCPTCQLTWALARDAKTCHHPDRVPDPYVCPRCGAVSWNPNDLANRYCGRCHQYEDLANVVENLNLGPTLRQDDG